MSVHESSAARSLASARQVPLVFWPLVVLGVVLTLSIWFAPVGVPLLGLSLAMVRMASAARRDDGVWSRAVRPVIAIMGVFAGAASLLGLRFAIVERFDFASAGSAPALVLLFVWSGFILTMCVSIWRFAMLRPREKALPSLLIRPIATVRDTASSLPRYWQSGLLACIGGAVLLIGLAMVPNVIQRQDRAALTATQIMGYGCIPGFVAAWFYSTRFAPDWSSAPRRMFVVALTIGLGAVGLIAWAAQFVDNSVRSIPYYLTLPALLLILAFPPVVRRNGRRAAAGAGLLLSIGLLAGLVIGVDASRCDDDDCIPATAAHQMIGLGLYWSAVGSIEVAPGLRRFLG